MSGHAQARVGNDGDVAALAQALRGAQTRDQALDAAVKAAENAMKALSLAKLPDEKSRCRARTKTLLQGAETIKHSTNWQQVVASMADLLQPYSNNTPKSTRKVAASRNGPHSTRTLTTREKIILAKATFLNGTKFPAWETAPAAEEFQVGADGGLFVCVSLHSFLNRISSSPLTLVGFQRRTLRVAVI